MKKLYFAYNEITKEYSLDYGTFGVDLKKRVYFNNPEERVFQELKDKIPLNKKAEFYMEKDISDYLKSNLEKFLSKSLIKLIFVDNLRDH